MENIGPGEILIYQSADGAVKVDVCLRDETVWLNQAQLCTLFPKSKATVSEHIRNLFLEGELDENSVVRNVRPTASDGKSTKPGTTIWMWLFPRATGSKPVFEIKQKTQAILDLRFSISFFRTER